MNTETKRKRGRPSKKNMIQVHGKDESKTLIKASNIPSSLDEILGETLSVYTAKNSDEYKRQLTEMNMTDLQSHAYKLGLVPTEDRKVLTDRLVTEFMKWHSRFQTNNVKSNNQIKSIEDLDAKAKKILREGA